MEREDVTMEDFLRRRLNPFLLISTVAVLTILAGLSVTYQDVLSEKVSDNQQLEQELEDKNSRISTLEGRVSNLTGSLSRARQDLAATVNETRRQENLIEELQGEVSSLEDEVSTLEDTVAEKESTIGDLEDEVDTLEVEISNRESNLETICGDVPAENMTDDAEDACDGWW
ncbi:MAG: hypothetical protein MUP63_03155 [Candidatus Nanohaloarchaeota archaeon QJJ-7]|nr:hypothetical protein [Candidatus Nanohaloarchaeota archaeon QJJ-7]